MDLNEHQTPNGGWQFYQPETKWGVPRRAGAPVDRNDPTVLSPISITLNQLVLAIIAMRKRNPAITAKFKLSTNYEVVKSEAIRYNRKRLGMPEEATPVPFQAPHSISRSAAGAAVAANWARRTRTGIETLADWLGEGAVPVASELSEQRATTCSDCPQNQSGDLMSLFTKPVSDLIIKQLEERKQLNLSTTKDDLLNVCKACGCPLKLKVHVPLSVINGKMKQPEREKLDPRCWILKEN